MRGRRKKQQLSLEEIRKNVDVVMQNWQTYPTFAALFDALLLANDNMGNKEFIALFNKEYPNPISKTTSHAIRNGFQEPTYDQVKHILDANLLQLDPAKIGCESEGIYRKVLFTMAGLTEVTPASVREWNQKVINNHSLMPRDGIHLVPTWQELIYKLLSFHMQGERMHMNDLADAANHLPATSTQLTASRCQALLVGHARPIVHRISPN